MASRPPPESSLVSPPSNNATAGNDASNQRTDTSFCKAPLDADNAGQDQHAASASTSSTVFGENTAAQRTSVGSLAATQHSIGSDNESAESNSSSAPLTAPSQSPASAPRCRKVPAAEGPQNTQEGIGRSVTNAWQNKRTSFVPLPSPFDVKAVTPKPSTGLRDDDSRAGSLVSSSAGSMSSAGITTVTSCEEVNAVLKGANDTASPRLEAVSAAFGGSQDDPPVPAPDPPSTFKVQQRQSQSNERYPVGAQSDHLEDALENSSTAAKCQSALVDASVSSPSMQRSENDDRQWRRPEKTPRILMRPSVDLDDSFFELMHFRRSPRHSISVPRQHVTTAYVLAAFLGIVVIVVLLIILVPFSIDYNRTKLSVCDTSDCLQHADIIASIINRTIDPCYDFSAYVCSGWRETMSALDSEQGTSVLESLRFSWYRDLHDVLLKGSLAIPAGRKPLAMYEKCMEYIEHSGSHTRSLRDLIAAFPISWPAEPVTDLPAISTALLLAYRWQVPFWIAVTVLEESSSEKRRVIAKPGYYVPLIREHHNYVRDSYVQYYKSYYAAIFPERDVDRDVNDTAIDEIRAMEDFVSAELDSIIRSENKNPALFSFGNIDADATNAPADYWMERFQMGLLLWPALTLEDELAVSDVSLLKAFTTLALRYGEEKLNALLEWQVVQLYSPLADTRLLVALYGSKHRADISRTPFCAHHVEGTFKVPVLYLGVSSRLTAEDREDIDAGFDSLVTAAVSMVNDSTWMDDDSKSQVADKLASVRKQMWPAESVLANGTLEKLYASFSENETFPVQYKLKAINLLYYMNFTRDFKEAMSLLGNNFPLYLDYNYLFNYVEVAIGAAGAPAYYRYGTGAMFYGGLGFLMAMQLVRSIDSVGLKWMANGTNVPPFLTESTLRSYYARVRCLSREAVNTVFPEIPALEIAYSALKASSLRGDREHLPLSADLTEDAVFFLTICYMTCAKNNNTGPPPADCNKIVQNSEAFAKAYRCPKGSRMNPEKCSFFY